MRWQFAVGLAALLWIVVCLQSSRRRCLRAATELIARAGRKCGLAAVNAAATEVPTTPDLVSTIPSSTRHEKEQENWANVDNDVESDSGVVTDDSGAVTR